MAFLDNLEFLYHETTEYFDFARRGEEFDYQDLVVAHLREAPRSYLDAQERLHNGRRWFTDNMGDPHGRGEAMMCYWDYMPKYVAYMASKGWTHRETIEEAWIVLIFRAFLRQRGHTRVQNEPRLPSKYYGNQMPV